MLINSFLVALLASTAMGVELRDVMDSKLFDAHLPSTMSSTRITELLNVNAALRMSSSGKGMFYYCGAIEKAVEAKRTLTANFEGMPSHNVRTAYVKRSRDLACLSIESTDSEISRLGNVISSLELERLDIPDMFKIDPTVLSVLSSSINNDFMTSSHMLTLEYTSRVSSHESDLHVQDILDTVGSMTAGLQLSAQWADVSSRIHGSASATSSGCNAAINGLHRVHHSNSVVFTDLSTLRVSCLVHLVERAAVHPSVQRVSLAKPPKALNYQGVGMTQSGNIHDAPYREAGLLGQNEICGVADSGVDDLSCFLADASHMRTPRDAMVHTNMRKIIQYIPFGDEMDDLGGHGTHVVGTIVGSSLYGGLEIVDGVAPEAKVSFFDIGQTHEDYLLVPDLEQYVLPMAYDAGARVHSNSWGGFYNQYDYFASQVDSFTYDHSDMFVVFAAGNDGEYGSFIASPATSKNALVVGASVLRDDIDDTLLSNRTVASFSSHGPTSDGRVKPDILAPGDFLVSAFGGEESATCAALEKSGTSMAAPVAAGNALLVRQYFRDTNFWESLCDSNLPNCHAFSPSGYFVKAVLLHAGTPMSLYVNDKTGDRLPLGAPLTDGYQGYGQIQLDQVLPLSSGKGLDSRLNLIVFDGERVTSHDMREWNITVHDNMPLKVTLCWYDPASTAFAFNNLLLHDLDLRVIGPDGVVHWGNNQHQPDDVNPNEQVYIAEPNPSTQKDAVYTIQVMSHYLTEATDQEFAVVITTSGEMEKPMNKTDRRLSSASVTHDDYIRDTVMFPFNDVLLGVEAHCFEGSFPFFSMPMFSFDPGSMPDDIKDEEIVFDFEPVSKSDMNIMDLTETKFDFSMEGSFAASYDFDFSSDMKSLNLGSMHFPSFPDLSFGWEFSMPGSFDFSFEDKCKYVPNQEVIHKFVKKGKLEKVTLELDANVFGSAGGYFFTVIIMDPEGHTLQIGGSDYYAAKDFFYLRHWPDRWIVHHTNDPVRSTRDVSALEMMSDDDKEWTIAVAFGLNKSPMYPMPFSGDISLDFAMKQTPEPTTAPSSAPTAAPNITPKPTSVPTSSQPTRVPTSKPSQVPTRAPTPSPTSTRYPTQKPTRRPTPTPTKAPTLAKTKVTYNHDLTFGGMDPDALRNDAKAQLAARKTYADTVDYVTYDDVSIASISNARRLSAVIEHIRSLAGGAKITFSVAVILEDAGFSVNEVTSFLTTVQEKVQQTVDSGTFTQTLVAKFAEENVTSINAENFTITSEMDYTPDVEILATAAPTPAPTTEKSSSSADTADTSVIIIGAVVGGVAFIFLVGVGMYFYATNKKKSTVHVTGHPQVVQHSNSVVPYSP